MANRFVPRVGGIWGPENSIIFTNLGQILHPFQGVYYH